MTETPIETETFDKWFASPEAVAETPGDLARKAWEMSRLVLSRKAVLKEEKEAADKARNAPPRRRH